MLVTSTPIVLLRHLRGLKKISSEEHQKLSRSLKSWRYSERKTREGGGKGAIRASRRQTCLLIQNIRRLELIIPFCLRTIKDVAIKIEERFHYSNASRRTGWTGIIHSSLWMGWESQVRDATKTDAVILLPLHFYVRYLPHWLCSFLGFAWFLLRVYRVS